MSAIDNSVQRADKMQTAQHSTLSFLTWSQYYRLYSRRLRVEQSLGDGLYCEDDKGEPITQEVTQQLTAAIRELLESENPIQIISVPRKQLIEYFTQQGMDDKVGVLKTWFAENIKCIKVGEIMDYIVSPISTDLQRLKIFELLPYRNGLIIRYPDLLHPDKILPFNDQPFLFDMFKEYSEWARLLKVDNVAHLNDLIFRKKITDVKWIAEGLHDNKYTEVADYLCAQNPCRRVITITGPSASGKTTFALRLCHALRANGFESLVLDMDDFYKDMSEIPTLEDGHKDWLNIDAMNLDYLAERVHAILNGETVPRRKFIFKQGLGVDINSQTLTLNENGFLIIEGFHGLNPELINRIGAENVVPIYVGCLTPVNIDGNHRFPTTALRLIRKIVRDYKIRGYTPRQTIRKWPVIRANEEKFVYPFHGNAEFSFNSALIYEIPVYAVFAKSLIAEATVPDPDEDNDDPATKAVSREAQRLMLLMNFFYPISVEEVPHISCIREFVGGSDLKY